MSADHHTMTGVMRGELTPDELVKMAEEAAIEEETKRTEEAGGKAAAPALDEKDADGADGVNGATGVGADGEDSARRGGTVDSLNLSSSGKEGVSSVPDPSADPALDPALDKKDADVAHVADGADGADDEQVNHRGGGRRLFVDSDNSDDEDSGDKTGGQTDGKTTGEGVESDGLQDTDTDAESASGVSADHCATLGIAHNAPKTEIKKAYRTLALQLHPDKNPNDVEGASERFREVKEAYDFLLAAARKAARKAQKKAKATAAAAAAARNARKAEQASDAWKARKAVEAKETRKAANERKAEQKRKVRKARKAEQAEQANAGAAAAGSDVADDAGSDDADDADSEEAADSDSDDSDDADGVGMDDVDGVEGVDDARADAGTTGMTGTMGNGKTDGKTDGSDEEDDEAAAAGGESVDEPVDEAGKTAGADGVDGADASVDGVDGADADAEKAGVSRTEEDMEADEEDEKDELIDVLELGYTHEELLMFKHDSPGQFKTLHRAMINGGDGVDMADLDPHDMRNIAKIMAKFLVAVDSPGSANEASSISYLRLTYSKCPLVNENAIITGVAPVEKSTIKELAGDNAVAIWLEDIHKDTGVKRYDNSRVYRSVKFDPSLFPALGELDLRGDNSSYCKK